MSNYYKRKNSFSFLGLFIVAMVLVLCVGALGWLSSGFRDWNAAEWFKKPEVEDDDDGEETAIHDGTVTYIYDL